ncbi:MAG TPA: energy-coupling factor ABC transporter permease [Stenomitos sp.]
MMKALVSIGLLPGILHWNLPLYVAMHIPDGYLNFPLSVLTWTFSIGLIALALKRVQATYQERAVPFMGVCAAFIFAAQMINFPIPGGTSGHLLGGTLAGALLGPWAGSLVMAVVFIVQAVIFQDGGISALGANIFNMGLIGTFGGYYLFRGIRYVIGRDKLLGMATGAAISAWMSVVAASVMCAVELSFSGAVPFTIALTAIVAWHILIGVGESLITVATLTFIWRTRPDLIYAPPRKAIARPSRSLSVR